MAPPLTLSQLGEDALVERLVGLLPGAGPLTLHGPGDDCAVVRSVQGENWKLLKADSVVEGIHFLSGENLRRVGWKAVCRAVSDIAAMGGEPEHALVSLVLRPDLLWEQARALYEGVADAARAFHLDVAGGETSHSGGPLVCSVFLSGRVEPECCVLRSGGSPGDVLLVSGRLGGSFGSGKHLDFTPRLAEARWLVRYARPKAMMDISDGLAMDARRLAQASGCGVRLEPGAIPCNPGVSLESAVGEGEDFELLLAVEPACVAELQGEWKRVFPSLPLSVVGELTEAAAGLHPSAMFDGRGYDHFKQS